MRERTIYRPSWVRTSRVMQPYRIRWKRTRCSSRIFTLRPIKTGEARKASSRTNVPAYRRCEMAIASSGSTPAASIRTAAQSFQKPSTLCSNGVRKRAYVTHIYLTRPIYELVLTRYHVDPRSTSENITDPRHDICQYCRAWIQGNIDAILSRFSFAQRMRWASKRVTTRVEDIAYSLISIFDVNMPLLYGEGEKAFRRLQEAILRTQEIRRFSPSEQSPQDIIRDTPRFWPLTQGSSVTMLAASGCQMRKAHL
jgi:hypothetical protein